MEELLNYIINNKYKYDAIVVEGYDGVGKGRVLEILSGLLRVIPYRPDYNLWQEYDHRVVDRWKVSGFFWDVFSYFGYSHQNIMLFDRGVLSGAVYNNDMRIAEDYPKILRNAKLLHILVTCSEEDYINFARIRGVDPTPYSEYLEYTERYRECFKISGVEYIEYQNIYDESLSPLLAVTCRGCGHYNHGYCRNKRINRPVDPDSVRCEYSHDKEVQDVTEMLCV